MAFVKVNLLEEMEKFADESSSNFIEYPQSTSYAAEYWANALDVYGATITPPSTAVTVAHTSFVSLFNTMTPLTGLAVFPTCFAAYATALASGMSPSFIGTPPPILIDFTAVGTLSYTGGNQTQCLSLIVDILDVWFRTGVSVPSGGGSPVNWS